MDSRTLRRNLTYDYVVRVYKVGSPAGSTPLASTGTVVNAY